MNTLLKRFNIVVTRRSLLDELKANSASNWAIQFLQSIDGDEIVNCLKYWDASKSQLKQDLFVLAKHSFKRNGYFIEFGATNGVDLSNSYLLENAFGWRGVLAEPARVWHEALCKNRTAFVDKRCVWKSSDDTMEFVEANIPELSTISSYKNEDSHARLRQRGNSYPVVTVSLLDLLKSADAPKDIDYLSLDTEGTEFDILSAFDFEAYNIKVITCEHNYTTKRTAIHELLSKKGYIRECEHVSEFDDWYVRKT